MVTADVALIGGTGIGSLLSAQGGKSILIPTVHGPLRGRLLEKEGVRTVVVSRHSSGHSRPPHSVPYVAIAHGLKAMRVKGCLSTAAVGSLRLDWPVGTLAVCTDMIDFSCRNITAIDRGVKHVDFSTPFPLSGEMASVLGASVVHPCVYANVNGPRYETPSEIEYFSKVGADVVGMTAGSEAVALRESGIAYGCLAIVTNMACGIGEIEPDHEAVSAVVASQSGRVVEHLFAVAKCLAGAR